MLTYTLAAKGGLIQASASHQMQQWLSESDKEAPWTPLSLTSSSAGHVASNSAVVNGLDDILDNCAAQTSTHGNTNT